MPLIDIRCLSCGTVSEVLRPVALWPAVPPCPACAGPAEQVHLPPPVRAQPDPVVIYQMPDGSYRFPGAPDSPSTHRYASQGGTRLELRGWAQVRAFESQMNAAESRKIHRQFERKQRAREEGESQRRAELRRRVQSFTAGGQAFARTLLQHMDRRPHSRPGEPGFRVEAYSESRSNREESRDDRGHRRRD